MTAEYAVKAETKEGETLTLRRGFPSYEAAEDHKVQASLWARVWIEIVGVMPEKAITPPALPPKPYALMTSGSPSKNGTLHLYLIDATGRKIAAIWGKPGEKELIAEHILALVNGEAK
jgi:hypothetical protein